MRRRLRSVARSVAAALVMVLLAAGVQSVEAAQAFQEPGNLVSDQMRSQLQATGSVALSVTFLPAPGPATGDTASYAQAIRADEIRTPRVFTDPGVDVLAQLDSAPAAELVVTTSAALEALGSDPAITSMVIPPFQADLSQGDSSGPGSNARRGAERATAIEADQMHALGFRGNDVRVAILDTGVELDHPDLAGSIVYERCFQVFALSQCPNGLDQMQGPGSAAESDGHGTAMASLIASEGGSTPLGVAPDVDLELIRMSNGVDLNLRDALLSLDHVLAERVQVQVVLMSFGSRARFGGTCDRDVWPAFFDTVAALRARGVVVVASSGNDADKNQQRFPACLGDVHAVTALDVAGDDVAPIANISAATDLAAPGSGVVVHDRTTMATGTSVSAALVAGCAALALDSGQADGSTATAWLASPNDVVVSTTGHSVPTLQCAPHCFGAAATVNLALDESPTAGDDVIVGSNGPDVVFALPGNDAICAGPGDDEVFGGQGDDRIDGQSGADLLWGNFDDDIVRGGAGDDTVHGNHGADVLSGQAGDDRIYGYTGDDELSGGRGDDRLHGNRGSDVLGGDSGNDLIFGYAAADALDGGSGQDLCRGNGGADTLVRCELVAP